MSAQLIHEGTQPRSTEPTASAGRAGRRTVWHRIRMTVAEMNYATRRLVELQAPWSVDEQWHTR
jgi:hypothetical protein